MVDIHPSYFVCGVIGIIAAGFALKHYRKRWRTRAMEEAAASLGFDFTDKMHYTADFHGLAFLHHGQNHRFYNCIEGASGVTRVRIFDAAYAFRSSGNRQTIRHQTMISFCSSDLDLPDFSLRPETLIDRAAAGLFDMSDIDLDEYPEFSRAFLLNGSTESAVRELLSDPDLIDVLLRRRPIWVEGSGQQLVVYRRDRRVTPTRLREFFEEGFELFTTLAARCQAAIPTNA